MNVCQCCWHKWLSQNEQFIAMYKLSSVSKRMRFLFPWKIFKREVLLNQLSYTIFKSLCYYFSAYIHRPSTVKLRAFTQCSFRKDVRKSLALRAIILVEKNITLSRPNLLHAMPVTPKSSKSCTSNDFQFSYQTIITHVNSCILQRLFLWYSLRSVPMISNCVEEEEEEARCVT
jgi:hypothetical protein